MFKNIFKSKKRLKEGRNRSVSLIFAIMIIFETCWPTMSFALTGGPSQPEVQSFEPINTSDMVDLFSGDFSYNVPLFDMDGYPMNISYHSGITMDQEASWVGLGWNINPGVINRNMRGIPDEFNGDLIEKEQNVKKNMTIGVSCGFAGELFGVGIGDLSARLGIKYNNYSGVGIEQSFNVSIGASNKYGGSGCASLGITSSSDDGLSLQPSISLSQNTSKSQQGAQLGTSLGASFNSRGGLTQLTIQPDLKQEFGESHGDLGGLANSILGIPSAKFNFGQQTYAPNLDFPMENLSVTANIQIGIENMGLHGSIAPGAYFSMQKQAKTSIKSPAFGYMNAHNGQFNDAAMMDFNREKEGSFTSSSFNLPITNLTYDLYSVSAQGGGGSYRPFRNDVGHVFDASSWSTSTGNNIGVEIGAGNIGKLGINYVVNSAYSQSGDWSDSKAAENVHFIGEGSYPDYEPYYFKEANEKSVSSDPAFIDRYGGYSPSRFSLDGGNQFDIKTTGSLQGPAGGGAVSPNDHRKSRDKRGQTISTITNLEVNQGMGLFGAAGSQNTFVNQNINTIGHHVGQVTSLGIDGKRYVYALPAYNVEQKEITFAVGVPVGGGSARTVDPLTKLVDYQDDDITVNNDMGLDNYYQNTKMPPFAHSYLLSAVLSPDYVDVTGNGPSDDDLGNYVLFDYIETTTNNKYDWRTPFEIKKAQYSEGLLADVNDDKGSIVYGKKQLYFLSKITTKNYIADFETSPRLDSKEVANIHGGPGASDLSKKLDKIVIKSKAALKTIKTVHFDYDYSLCPGTPNSSSGKLTLKKLFFTYQNSDKGAYNNYKFHYSSFNPIYSHVNVDRWGNYKGANAASDIGCVSTPTAYFPYTNQYEGKNLADQNASAWNLNRIELPSGGEINIDLESDDYAYVQDKQATQMYLFNDGSCPTNSPLGNISSSGWLFKFKIPNNIPNPKIKDFLPDDNMVYFKFKMRINSSDKMDYVPGYAEVDLNPALTTINGNVGQIHFKSIPLDDKPDQINQFFSPFARAALQFGRLNTPRTIWNQPNASASISQQAIMALVNSNFFSTISQTIQGPNKYLFNQGCGQFADLSNCWIKLKNVTGFKYGGGSRVKSIRLKDNFNAMTGTEANSEYGQVYEYKTTEQGKTFSTGVASYEPQVGGEENALKKPFFTETKHLLAPDDNHFVEAPFGESFYPSASVGYSEVIVKTFMPVADFPVGKTINDLKQHSPGYVINQFYTSKDFPTISERTDLEAIQHKSSPFDITSLLSIETKDHMTASQGFYVELNDMNGKPKATYVVNSFNNIISSVEYFYKSKTHGPGTKRLVNTVKSIKPNGGITSSEVGVFFDAVGDLRQQSSESESEGINVNIDAFYLLVPVITTVPIPSYTSDETQFRSAVFTKVVQRFGILEKTVTKKDGSTVTSTDLAYDAETGAVLLTQTANDFNDPVFSFKYPAYWYYPNMGSAGANINYTQDISLVNSEATFPAGNNKFKEGDEVELITPSPGSTYTYAWVTKSISNKIELRNRAGAPIANGLYRIKVLRSGMRNMQTMDMANIVTMVNPLNGIGSNVYQKVISAKAIEFGDRWRENCDCKTPSSSSNAFIQGVSGNWRPLRSYEYLTDRTQTNSNNNSNVRVDGLFASYSPFYKNFGGKWGINPQGWTFASQVTEFNPYSQELENKDALNRYSSATFGFNQTMATAVGANSKYSELAYDSFEDYSLLSCSDKHFKMPQIPGNAFVTTNTAHTGRNSMKVINSVELKKTLVSSCGGFEEGCDMSIKYITGANRYEIFNGTPPYTFDYQVISGTGFISVSNDGVGFKVLNPVGGFKATIKITDKNNCSITKLLQAPYTN